MVISPLSVVSALTLLSEGATPYAYKKMIQQLHLSANPVYDRLHLETLANLYHKMLTSLQTNGTSLVIANRIYVQDGQPLNQEFRNLAREKFFSDIVPLNFTIAESSSKQINRYVESKTNGKIPKIISPNMIDECAELLLVNAIYLKANWEHRFDKRDTIVEKFHLTPNKTVPVEFMKITQRFRYGNLPQLKASVLEMRYAQSNYAFVIVLPHKGSNLTQLEKSLNHNEFNTLAKGFGMVEVNVQIPKFKIEFELNLKRILTNVCVHLFFFLHSISVFDLCFFFSRNFEIWYIRNI